MSSLPFLVRKTRLISGLVLFSYVLTHFLNHAFGLISLQALETTRIWFLWFWRFPPLSFLLYAALATHLLLAVWAVYQRRQLLRMRASEALQLVLGLAIVPLLAKHVLGTRVASTLFDFNDSYTYVLLVLWHVNPAGGAQQAVALVVAWVHGCIGLWFWLRLKPIYRRLQFVLFAGALLVPVLALLGFYVAGRDVMELARDPDWLRMAATEIRAPSREAVAQMAAVEDRIVNAFFFLLAATLAARLVRSWVERRRGLVRLIYPGGREVRITPGMSILEASQAAGIPHASVCGGRGRCSTCRVRISRGLEQLPPPSSDEQAVLRRVGAPPNVRLACQTRPRVELAVAPLLPPAAGPRAGFARSSHLQGHEKEIAILFADLRGFTAIAEHKLPYDIVFVLNRYFAAMGQAIEQAGGHIDKFIGDGVMALFGIEGGARQGARQALAAARSMGKVLAELNETLTHDLDKPLRIGIGIHVGPAIVGEMGYARAVSLTAIGDTVNTASRLEGLTKEFEAELVVSEPVAEAAGVDLAEFPMELVEIRGRSERLAVRAIARAAAVPDPEKVLA
ncbi:MAG TPA: adenylate/guanylate cyclase domain-containing protein [Alphaproteobacteria bacterium]|nr:adenylate/guanylate cyclase domain-containing protein [Alphaproteobacteria bacterium]